MYIFMITRVKMIKYMLYVYVLQAQLIDSTNV